MIFFNTYIIYCYKVGRILFIYRKNSTKKGQGKQNKTKGFTFFTILLFRTCFIHGGHPKSTSHIPYHFPCQIVLPIVTPAVPMVLLVHNAVMDSTLLEMPVNVSLLMLIAIYNSLINNMLLC